MDFSKKIIKTPGLTFDDVLLLPDYADFLPDEVNLSTWLTKNISLKAPLMTAAMDSVTESAMAIAIAREGGVGVIHRNFDPTRQAQEVSKVKRSGSEVIRDPFTLTPDQTLYDALELMQQRQISGVPIVDSFENRRLVGIITSRDLRFEEDFSAPIGQKMVSDARLIKAPLGISAQEAQDILQQHKIEKLPLVDERGRLQGLITMKDITQRQQFPNAMKDSHGRLLVAAAIGAGEQEIKRAEMLLESGADIIVIDTAHGYTRRVIETLATLKRAFPETDVIAGNIATPKGALALIEAGADAIKVGMGPGSICTTRIISGMGVPQITAILEIAQISRKYGVPLIADGGIKYSGDITKALAAGADVVMAGSLFAGAEESPGERVILEGRAYKMYRGMGSEEAMQKRGGKDRYGQKEFKDPIPEGIEGRVPYKGTMREIVYQLMGGVKAGMAYCGTRTIPELQERGRFIQITHASLQESHPHDITITKESRNYSR